MSHSRQREAIREELLRRQAKLLEAVAMAVDADVEAKEQCPRCAQWFKAVSKHEPHCDGLD